MGIYNDITNDMGSAFNHDLSDTVYSFNIIHVDPDKEFFDATSRNYYSGCLTGSWRGVKAGITKKDREDIGTEPVDFKLISLDAEKPTNISNVTPNDTIQLTSEETYVVALVNIDPSHAVWTMYCRGLGNAT